MLPSKTMPEVNRKGHTRVPKAKAKLAHSAEIDETEDDRTPHNVTMRNASFDANVSESPTSSSQIPNPKKVRSLLCRTRFASTLVS